MRPLDDTSGPPEGSERRVGAKDSSVEDLDIRGPEDPREGEGDLRITRPPLLTFIFRNKRGPLILPYIDSSPSDRCRVFCAGFVVLWYAVWLVRGQKYESEWERLGTRGIWVLHRGVRIPLTNPATARYPPLHLRTNAVGLPIY